jgi:hypothetical protein
MPTSAQQLNDSFDRFAETVLRVKRERDELLKACQRAYEELDNHYEVDRGTDYTKEYPFNGAGVLMSVLKRAIDKATR